MKKSIYDVYVTVTSQEQADRLKAICLKYGLPIWVDGFEVIKDRYVTFCCGGNSFWVNSNYFTETKTQITESDFIQLAKEFKQ